MTLIETTTHESIIKEFGTDLSSPTMHAAVVTEFGKDLIVAEVPVPRPGPGQALVKLIASGVCHTDLHAAEGD